MGETLEISNGIDAATTELAELLGNPALRNMLYGVNFDEFAGNIAKEALTLLILAIRQANQNTTQETTGHTDTVPFLTDVPQDTQEVSTSRPLHQIKATPAKIDMVDHDDMHPKNELVRPLPRRILSPFFDNDPRVKDLNISHAQALANELEILYLRHVETGREDIAELLKLYFTGNTRIIIANKFGVSPEAIGVKIHRTFSTIKSRASATEISDILNKIFSCPPANEIGETNSQPTEHEIELPTNNEHTNENWILPEDSARTLLELFDNDPRIKDITSEIMRKLLIELAKDIQTSAIKHKPPREELEYGLLYYFGLGDEQKAIEKFNEDANIIRIYCESILYLYITKTDRSARIALLRSLLGDEPAELPDNNETQTEQKSDELISKSEAILDGQNNNNPPTPKRVNIRRPSTADIDLAEKQLKCRSKMTHITLKAQKIGWAKKDLDSLANLLVEESYKTPSELLKQLWRENGQKLRLVANSQYPLQTRKLHKEIVNRIMQGAEIDEGLKTQCKLRNTTVEAALIDMLDLLFSFALLRKE